MVVFYLRNSRAPEGKVVPVTVALNKEVIYPYFGAMHPDLKDQEGDGRWVLTLSTAERDADGDPISTETINTVNESTLHLELEAALGRIGQKVAWGSLAEDRSAPKVVELVPSIDQVQSVPIASNIKVRLKDSLPAAGIDLSTLNMSLNGFPVISGGMVQPGFDVDMLGNIFDLTIVHRPLKLLE